MQTFVAVSTADRRRRRQLRRPQRRPSATPEPELEHFVSTKTYHARRHRSPFSRRSPTSATKSPTTARSKGVPANQQANVRNQMYLTSETLRLLAKVKGAPSSPTPTPRPSPTTRSFLDKSTKFIPTWVKVAVALALGLGTMIGWKRIVVTVGEKIGKTHMTYAQGASAELITMVTILGADHLGVPVSTTHILNSGVAGTMAANRAACSSPPSATSPWPGSSPCPPPPCSPAASSTSSTRSPTNQQLTLTPSWVQG